MYHRTGFVVATAAACAGLLGLTATAGAQTKVVYAGPPPGVGPIAAKFLPKSFAATNNPDINAFFRQRVTINVGDTVNFQLHGFHTVDLPGPSGSDLPLVLPQGTMVSGSIDAAGNPFWFNGKVPNIGFNPALLGPSRATTYDGTARVDSGLPLGPPSPVKIRFARAGTFKYVCDVHHGMVGYVVVKPKHRPVPTAKQDRAALITQVTAAVKSAKQIAGRKVATDTVSLGLAGSGGVELFRMFPSTLTVSPGTTVTFTMSRGSREQHTTTFGPIPYLKSLVKAFRGKTISPIAAYPSDPVRPITLGPSSHGNGFASLGVLSRDPTTPQPSSGQIKFTTAGSYHFVCLIHPFMRGTIIVK